MDLIIKAIILGIVEGVTEFLPISSTGHLILFGHFLGFTGKFATMFEIIIQLGAILAVVYFYRSKIWSSLQNLKPGAWGFKLWFWIIIAFLPSAILGFTTNDYIEQYFFSPLTVSIALVVGAFLILIVEQIFAKRNKCDDMMQMTTKKSLIVGLGQCMALIPGMSRSASTIMGGMFAGFSIKAAAEFSFFLAIPTMFAATGFSLLKGFAAMTMNEWVALAVGFVVSFIVALLVIGKFLAFLGKHSLKVFAYYRLVVGIIMLILISQNIIKF